jgi:hypothetical protein
LPVEKPEESDNALYAAVSSFVAAVRQAGPPSLGLRGLSAATQIGPFLNQAEK